MGKQHSFDKKKITKDKYAVLALHNQFFLHVIKIHTKFLLKNMYWGENSHVGSIDFAKKFIEMIDCMHEPIISVQKQKTMNDGHLSHIVKCKSNYTV